jgi:hypothetical protein
MRRDHPLVPDLVNPYRPRLDKALMRKALALRVEPIGDFEYHVTGEEDDYYVALHYYFSCDCADFIYRDRICKHLLASLVVHGDREALALHEIASQERETEPPPTPKERRAKRAVAALAAVETSVDAVPPAPLSPAPGPAVGGSSIGAVAGTLDSTESEWHVNVFTHWNH